MLNPLLCAALGLVNAERGRLIRPRIIAVERFIRIE
jgi:hypothetical protein